MLIKWHWVAKDNKLRELKLSPRLPIIVKGSEWNALLGAAEKGFSCQGELVHGEGYRQDLHQYSGGLNALGRLHGKILALDSMRPQI